jgi:uncharacterized phage infection (PIP) family protein YhgE
MNIAATIVGLGSPFFVILAALLGWWLSRRSVRPLRRSFQELEQSTSRLAEDATRLGAVARKLQRAPAKPGKDAGDQPAGGAVELLRQAGIKVDESKVGIQVKSSVGLRDQSLAQIEQSNRELQQLNEELTQVSRRLQSANNQFNALNAAVQARVNRLYGDLEEAVEQEQRQLPTLHAEAARERFTRFLAQVQRILKDV